MHRRLFLTSASGSLIAAPAFAQKIGDLVRAVTSAQATTSTTVGGLPVGVTTSDAEGGLRQALTNGAIAAVLKVGKLDGFWTDNTIRIPLPGTLGQIQKNLKPLGLSKPLDDLQLRINRGAETAAPKARDLFVGAIKSMTVEDVVGVLRGGQASGTDYLRRRTGDQLATQFKPTIETALASSGALKSLESVVEKYGAEGLIGGSPRESLVNFAVGKALDGLFHYVGQEEIAIRSNPAKRGTDLLRKVFGGL